MSSGLVSIESKVTTLGLPGCSIIYSPGGQLQSMRALRESTNVYSEGWVMNANKPPGTRPRRFFGVNKTSYRSSIRKPSDRRLKE
jgi:hypothetical protein